MTTKTAALLIAPRALPAAPHPLLERLLAQAEARRIAPPRPDPDAGRAPRITERRMPVSEPAATPTSDRPAYRYD